MNFPALSVIVPNYNHAQYLPRCLTAMVRQTVQPAEILVLDDASTDNSVELIESFAKNHPVVHLHRNEKNLGIVANVDRGINLARGDYLAFAAADDEVAPGFFEKSLTLLAKHPHAALCCTIGEYRESATGLNWHMGVGVTDEPAYLSPARMVECERKGKFYIPPNSVIFKKSALFEVGRFRPELKFACDWFAMYVAGFRYGICFVPEPLAVFHVLPDSYYHRHRRDKVAYQNVIHDLLDLLISAEFRDAGELIREGGSLYLFGWPMLRAILSELRDRRFLHPLFLRKNLWHITRLQLKRVTPTFLGNWYLSVTGYRARPSKATSPSPREERGGRGTG